MILDVLLYNLLMSCVLFSTESRVLVLIRILSLSLYWSSITSHIVVLYSTAPSVCLFWNPHGYNIGDENAEPWQGSPPRERSPSERSPRERANWSAVPRERDDHESALSK